MTGEEHLQMAIAIEMRVAYNEFIGEQQGMVPFAVADSREAWLHCAAAALKVIAENRDKLPPPS